MFWVIIGAFQCVHAQLLTLTDQETGEAINLVGLSSNNNTVTALSNDKGEVDLSPFKTTGPIVFTKLGYKPVQSNYAELQKSGFQLQMVLTGVPLTEVLISSNKVKEKRENVAQEVQVLRRSELQVMNQSSMADVMTNTGSVMVQKSQQGGGSPIIRGFEANKVLMVVDGVRLNNAIYRGGHLQNIITLDNSIMQKVEVAFGPGSVVYGSDALGGVMHFFTMDPTLSTGDSTLVKANAYMRYSSASDAYAAHADISLGSQKFGSLTSFTYSKFDDLRQGSVRSPYNPDFGERPWYVERINGVDSVITNSDKDVQVGSGYDQVDLLQKFLYRPSDKVSHIVNLQYSTSSDVPRYDRLTQSSNGNPRFAEWYYGPQERLMASYRYKRMEDHPLYDHMSLLFAYQNIEESRNTRRFRTEDLNQQVEQLDILSFNADFSKFKGLHEIHYGAEANLNDVTSMAISENISTSVTVPSDTRYPDGGSTMNSFAIYGTHTWKINEFLVLNDGIRLSQVRLNSTFIDKTFFPFPFSDVEQNNTAVNGSLGLILKAPATWRFSINLSTGFRAPNVDDLSKVFESVPGSVIIPNPDLKPEYTYNGEIGISKTFGQGVNLSVLGYYTLYQDAITVQSASFNGQDSLLFDGVLSRVTSSANAGEAYLYGGEARLLGNLNETLSAYATFNYTYGRIRTDSVDYPLDHIPPIFGKLGIRLSDEDFRAEFFCQYSGWKRLKDYNLVGEDNIANATEVGMPSWFTLNARLNYQFDAHFNLQVACENILDQNYRVFASNISAPGRNFILTLRYAL